MKIKGILLGILVLALGPGPAGAGDLRRTTLEAPVRVDRPLPADLSAPAGRTRWDLTAVEQGPAVTVLIATDGASLVREERTPGGAVITRTTYTGDGALGWLFPDRAQELLRPGSRGVLSFEETTASGVFRVRAEVAAIGIGWVHLPAGPREAILQRAVVSREDLRGSSGLRPERIVDRWIDPRAGVVASASRPFRSGSRRGGDTITSAGTVQAVLEGASTLTISESQLNPVVGEGLLYGFDLGTVNISALDPNGYATAGDLVAQDVWDFSGNSTGTEVAFTRVPVDANQTCNTASCGYDDPNAILERNDIGFDDPDLNNWTKINTVAVKEVRAGDTTIWLRAGSINEGVSGAFGSGETRLCYETFDGVTRTEVPLWRFSHTGATERYFQPGDSWQGGPFNCEQNLFNQVCGQSQILDTLYSKACGTHQGRQIITAIKGGVITLPSGHTFNAILLSNVADFCVYLGASCGALGKVDEVRTVNYLWQAPYIGTLVRLESEQNAPDETSFTQVVETNISYGLFPPRSITVTGTTDTTISISWDPGLITNRISGYKVYWNTVSGSSSAYAFNSQADPNSISIAGTTATISGLTAGTDYYVTVTSLSVFPPNPTPPLPQVTYESLLYPTTVSGDPAFVYPAEVLATTTGGGCTPTDEVTNVTIVPQGLSDVQLCWDAATDPCLEGYKVLGSANAESETGYSTVADLGVVNCWTGSPTENYFLVTVKGNGADGPWGHYGQ